MSYDKFVNLHNHTTFSTFDGMCLSEDFVKYAVELNQKALAITDHGTVSGLLKHFKSCKDANINPLMGCECYFTLDHTKKIKNNYHMTIIAKSDKGYSNLMGLMTEENVNDFYLEIQPHEQGTQRKVNEFAFMINKKLGIPLVITCDSHYPRPEDAKTQWLLRKTKMPDATLEHYAGMHLHSRESVSKLWYKYYLNDIKEALNNTVKIADMCDVKLDFGNLLDLEWGGEDRTKRLKRLAIEGLKRLGLDNDIKYRKQLKHEVEVVIYHGFEDVFLATEDMVTWANSNGIQTGPGRGSGVGSLLAYCLAITKVDPLENSLLFERFLRKDKKKMPDIDVDFDSRFRDKVFEYLNKRHSGNCAQVINYGKYMIRNLFNDIIKVYNKDKEIISLQEKNRVTSILQEAYDQSIQF